MAMTEPLTSVMICELLWKYADAETYRIHESAGDMRQRKINLLTKVETYLSIIEQNDMENPGIAALCDNTRTRIRQRVIVYDGELDEEEHYNG